MSTLDGTCALAQKLTCSITGTVGSEILPYKSDCFEQPQSRSVPPTPILRHAGRVPLFHRQPPLNRASLEMLLLPIRYSRAILGQVYGSVAILLSEYQGP